MHANFSNTLLRTCGSKVYEKIQKFLDPLLKNILKLMQFNDQRLTGLHETAAINDFSYGVSDRGINKDSIITVENGGKVGWKIEDPLQTEILIKLQVE